jgi:hypothetical protein
VKRMLLTMLLVALAGLVVPAPLPARPRWHGPIHRFHEHDLHIWRSGHWVHGHHAQRFGWWWIVRGVWYWYPNPVYPYPDPYTPSIIVQIPRTTPPPTPAPVWYYCTQLAGYYPYVPQCPSGWQAVPATPPPGSASMAPTPTPPGKERR